MPFTPCARARASQTVSLIKKSCTFTFDPAIPVELRFQPCPFWGRVLKASSGHKEKKQLCLKVSAEQTLRGRGHILEKGETNVVYGISISARLEAPFLIALSSTLSKTPSVLFHKTSLGQRNYLSRKSCWENFFFLRTIATYHKG